jgi:hypothetical protein
MDDSDTTLIILEDAETALYVHSLVKNAARFSKDKEVMVASGVSYPCYITYLYLNFPSVKKCRKRGRARKRTEHVGMTCSKPSMTMFDLSIARMCTKM